MKTYTLVQNTSQELEEWKLLVDDDRVLGGLSRSCRHSATSSTIDCMLTSAPDEGQKA